MVENVLAFLAEGQLEGITILMAVGPLCFGISGYYREPDSLPFPKKSITRFFLSGYFHDSLSLKYSNFADCVLL